MKNLHLVISILIVIPIALVYGIFPGKFFPIFFDFEIASTDAYNIFRAMMGLYFSMVIIWIAGIFRPRFWETATLTNILFMSGLAAGRLLSIAADGVPSLSLVIGLGLEIGLAAGGYYSRQKYSIKQ